MARDDAEAIVAYLRTVPVSDNRVDDRRLAFPLPLLVRTLPQTPETAPQRPPESDASPTAST